MAEGNLRGRLRHRRTGTLAAVGLALATALLLFPFSALANHDASDFFIFAKTAAGPFAEDPCTGSGVKHVDISGSTSTFEGRVHSNANLYVTGQNNTFEDELTFGTNGEDCDVDEGVNTYNAGDPSDIDGDPTGVNDGWPGDLATYLNGDGATFGTDITQVLPGESCDVGSLTNGSTITLSAANGGDVVCNGSGLTKLDVNGVTMDITIVSHGPIEVSGQSNSLSPAAHGVLAWTDYELDVAVKFGGSNFAVPEQAIVFSGRGGIDTSGSNDAELCIQLIGQGPIRVPGSSSTFGPGSDACTGAPPPQPDVKITKTGNGTAPVGQTAQFTIEVENIGQAAATGVTLNPADTLPNSGLDWSLQSQGSDSNSFTGGSACSLSAADVLSCSFGTLPPGRKYRVVVTAPVTAQTVCGEKPNTAVVTATNEPQESTGNNSSSDTITIPCPPPPATIDVQKTADPTSLPEPGGDVTFDVVVTNESTARSVTITSLTDDEFGNLNGQGDCSVPQLIAASGSYSCSFTAPVNGDPGFVHTNTVTASGTDDGGNPVSDSDDATVTITDVPSTIEVTKDADPTSVQEPGGDVTFTVTVENTSTVDTVTIDSLTDTIFGDLNGVGTCDVDPPVVLGPGDDYTCELTEEVTGLANGTHTNTVTASGTDDDEQPVSDSDDATVGITANPGTVIVKKVMVGGTETFTFTGTPNGSISENNGTISAEVSTGQYASTETLPENWELVSIVCDDTDSTGDVETETATFDVAPGEDVTCTFTNRKKAQIVVEKQTIPDDNPAGSPFEFSGAVAASLEDGQSASAYVSPGAHQVTEAQKAGWDLTAIECSDDDSTGDLVTRVATFDVVAGEVVTCVFTNTKRGRIIVEKETDPVDSPQSFTFTASYDADGFSLLDNQSNTSEPLEPGTYSVSESATPGWTQTGATCDDGSPVDAIVLDAGEDVTCTFVNTQDATLVVEKVVVNDNGGTAGADDFSFQVNGATAVTFEADGQNDLAVAPGTYSVTEPAVEGYETSYDNCSNVQIPAGGTATCTITNDDEEPSLTLVKEVENDDGGQELASSWTLTASGPTGFSGTTPAANGASFDAGTYDLSESGPSGYSASAWECEGGDQTDDDTVVVGLGEDVTCTITNDDNPPSLTLVKVVVNDNGGAALPSAWTLTADGPSDVSGSGPSVASDDTFQAGTYDLSENGPSGYTASEWDCEGGEQADADTVVVGLGDDVTCTITNDDVEPSLTLVKEVLNDNGGTAPATAWTLTASGPTGFSGTTPAANGASFDAGTYNLSESGPAGYDASDWECEGGEQTDGDTVVVGLGDDVTCTITNDDVEPSLTLVKEVLNDNGGTAEASDWNLTASGPAGFTGAGPSVSNGAGFDAGTYDLSEADGPGGYEASDWDCTGESNVDGDTVQVGLGDEITCTITNDDVAPELTLVKEVVNDNGGTALPSAWTLTATGPSGFNGLGPTVTSGPSFAAGSYDLTESGPAGYDASDWDCAYDGERQGEPSLDGSSLQVELADEITCTIVNDDLPATLIVIKNVVNDNGGSATASSFQMSIGGVTAQGGSSFPGAGAPGVTKTLTSVGAYQVTEALIAGYTQAGASADCSGTIALGETKTCTITNNDVPRGQGSIDVQKSATPTSLKEPGGLVTFSVRITNTSADVGVTISSVVDDKFGDLDDSGGNGCFDVPINMAPGETTFCQFQAQVTGAGGTTHVNVVTASGSDENGNPVSDSDDARVDITERLIDLVIVKEATSPTPLNGIVNYSLTITNKGPDTATNVQVADPAPAGITYLTVSATKGSCNLTAALITCELGSLAPGETVTITVTGRATAVGTHVNTATVTGGGGRETAPQDNVDSAQTVVPAPLRPPTVNGAPKPQREICLTLTVTPKMITADGKPDRIQVRATAGKKRMQGVRVVVGGAGVKKTARTNANGVANMRINPKRAGIVRITAIETNQRVCGPKRIGVVGVFLPPLTG